MIDKETLFKKIGYEPHKEQWAIHNSTARYKIPCCGRRFGKSLMVGHDLTADLFEPDKRYWIVGPDYSLGEKEFRVVYTDLVTKLKMGSQIKASYNVRAGDMKITMPWNTHLEVKSAENSRSLVGEGLDGVVMSEAAKHTRETWERYVSPALADHRGWAKFPSTPEGFNWYHGLWLLGQMEEFSDYESWQLPSWLNPVVFPDGRDDEEIKKIEAVVSKAYFEQEYGAEFTSFEGQIFNEFDEKVHVTNIEYNPAWKNFWVFDYGFAAPFVCLDIMVDPSDNVYVWREYQVTRLSTWEHGHAIRRRENPQGFHVDGMFGDPRGADEGATLGLILGPIQARPVPWEQGIEYVKRWLKLQPDGSPKLLIDRSCHDLIRQMRGLRSLPYKEGRNPKEGQVDYDDHGPDALRYFFNEYYVLGAAGRLADLYGSAYRGSEAESFFAVHSKITLDA